MHFFRHLIARARRGAFENFRIVVVQPLDPLIAVQRLDPGAHPATKIAVTVGVDLDLSRTCHRHFLSLGQSSLSDPNFAPRQRKTGSRRSNAYGWSDVPTYS